MFYYMPRSMKILKFIVTPCFTTKPVSENRPKHCVCSENWDLHDGTAHGKIQSEPIIVLPLKTGVMYKTPTKVFFFFSNTNTKRKYLRVSLNLNGYQNMTYLYKSISKQHVLSSRAAAMKPSVLHSSDD